MTLVYIYLTLSCIFDAIMAKKGNILVVDDNKAIRTSLELLLPAHFERVMTIATPNQLPATLRENSDLDVVLLDMNFHAGINTGNEGMYWLREIKKQRPNISVVLFTAYADIELAVSAIKDGAIDFIEKPWDNNKLVLTLTNAVDLARNAQRIKALKTLGSGSEVEMFWGESAAMVELQRMVAKVAPTDANVLIMGENGTGKEMLAREIHSQSTRYDEPLVSVDMGAITENLFESELFGHAKGAFTDAKSERAGKFEVASGGTLFLDEIGNLPLHMQSKLLTVLQSRQVIRVGENNPRPIDIRLVVATNCDLQAMVCDATFREDLYYRINTIVLNLPPLRDREDDVVKFAEIFLVRYARKYGKKCAAFTPSALAKMRSHDWPGNIRELQHTIEKAVIMSDASTVSPEDLWIGKSASKSASVSALSPQFASIEEMERQMIRTALQENGDNYSEIANRLGITRQTLYNKIKRYNL